MNTVTLSPKFQVVIPQAIRKALNLKPGEQPRVPRYGDRVEFIPVRSIQEMRGFLRGMDTRMRARMIACDHCQARGHRGRLNPVIGA